MAIKDRKSRRVEHPFEHTPPHQEKFSVPVLGMEDGSTARPVDSHNINTQEGNAGVVNGHKYDRPVYDDLDSFAIHNSHTNGKSKE
jgi:hypothetical protein